MGDGLLDWKAFLNEGDFEHNTHNKTSRSQSYFSVDILEHVIGTISSLEPGTVSLIFIFDAIELLGFIVRDSVKFCTKYK